MKKIHKAVGNDLAKPALLYFRVKDGQVVATNGSSALKLPPEEVFGKALITNEDHFYIKGSEWASAKMHTAFTITRDALLFNARNKKGDIIGRVRAIPGEAFPEQIARFPDVDAVWPEENAICKVSRIIISPFALADLADAMGLKEGFKVQLTGSKSAIRLWPRLERESGGYAIFMPGDAKGWLEDDSKTTAEKKTTSTKTQPHTDLHKARLDIEEELKRLVELLPEEERTSNGVSLILGSIDDCLEIMDLCESDWIDERDELKKEVEQATDKVKELEQEAIDPEDLDDAVLLHVFGSDPIVCISRNPIDDQFIETLGKLTEKGKPHELMQRLENLTDPDFAKRLDEMKELEELLY